MCGISGCYLFEGNEAGVYNYLILHANQHRGQESAGICVYDGLRLIGKKGMGLVTEVFDRSDLRKLSGPVGIGHVRYSTTGTSELVNAQPFKVGYSKGELALAHNGDIVNSEELRRKLVFDGHAFVSETDSEVIARLLAVALTETDDMFEAFEDVMERLIGSYSLTVITSHGDLIAVRDPWGFRPLCLGWDERGFFVSSETVGLDMLGVEERRELERGEVVWIREGDVESKVVRRERKAVCMFEFVYFARPDSIIEGKCVYECRKCMGKRLAEEAPVECDLVVPVPDSGRTAALGYAESLGVPMEEGLIKNRYVGRTFIMPEQEERVRSIRVKLNPIRDVIKGCSLGVVDDSIVRGNTSRQIVEMLRDAGAREIHMRIASPPVVSPCYYGIDMATKEELIAADLDVPEICEKISADSLAYLSLEGLVESIGLKKRELCVGCLTGEYPTPVPE
ncbi:amidophosphoribosyltransferase [Methanopyrus sp. KOL6]|uniref:amidophosphoribosyltransferase n=1 Tax=Methanopyrus sp. KOL6 TaxID=1937004 RepID=UPI000B4B0A3F|nr:amidophosphoribosyltransferase [Methanopyrus sp. KOL6]